MISAPPYSVSSDFGQLVGMRHLISGIDCAIAGAATAAAPTAPRPVTLMKSRRFIVFSLDGALLRLLDEAWLSRACNMEHPASDFHHETPVATQKARPSREDRAFVVLLKA